MGQALEVLCVPLKWRCLSYSCFLSCSQASLPLLSSLTHSFCLLIDPTAIGLLITAVFSFLSLRSPIYYLAQKSLSFFSKRPDSIYFKLCRQCGLCCNYSTLPVQHKSSQRQCVSGWVWLCANKALLMKTEMWILCKFYMSQNIILLLYFSNHLKMSKTFFTRGPCKNRRYSWLWPEGCSLSNLGLDPSLNHIHIFQERGHILV